MQSFVLMHLGIVHKRRPLIGGEGVKEFVTECGSRRGGV